MIHFNKTACILTLSLLTPLVLTGCKSEPPVSFAQDVQPIIQKHCIDCHVTGGPGLEASGFAMDSYEGVMKGTRNGPMVIAGDSAGSNMLVLMEGRADPSISMPHGKMEGATRPELETIRAWIDQGAKNN
jgi:uncharacterized membrane protein